MTALVLIDHADGRIAQASRSAVTAAAKLGEVHALVAGSGVDAVAAQAASIPGVSKVLKADDAAYAEALPEPLAALLVSVAGPYDHVVVPATAVGKNVLPRAAALLDVQPISDVIEIVDADTFVRPIYAGSALATVRSADAKKLMTIRGSSFEPAAAEGGSAPVEAVSAVEAPGVSRFVSNALSASDRPELGSARVIVSGGRALGSSENFRVLDGIADQLGAAIGASRAAVDAGYAANDVQIGQTGKVVAPELYIAVGISGAIQHLAGMKDSKVIVAINKDEEAPIFQVADYGLVGDLFEILPQVEAELKKA